MMYHSDKLLPISALQHFLFCPRQCALIHVERLWIENSFTASGQILHERAHKGISESRSVKRVESALPLVSYTLGLIGVSDVVEFHVDGKIIPIEYKKGKPKSDLSDDVQLCAQSLCLGEMLEQSISEGYLFYYSTRHRKRVIFNEYLCQITLSTLKDVRDMIDNCYTPKPQYGKKCVACSFVEVCLPKSVSSQKIIRDYWQKAVDMPLGDDYEACP